MKRKLILHVAAGAAMAAMWAMPAAAQDAKIYAYASKANYCPAGLRPITIDGTICCGTPNQSMSYQAVKAHPVRKTRSMRRVAKVYCPEGMKGCYER
jgi:hypothetical protein